MSEGERIERVIMTTESGANRIGSLERQLLDARAEITRLRKVVALARNPQANAPHSPRCVKGDWPSKGMCFCQQDDRDPEDVLTAILALEATETPEEGM